MIGLPGFGSQATTRLAWVAVLTALAVALIGVLAFGAGRNPITSILPSETAVTPASAEPSGLAEPSVGPSVGPAASLAPSGSMAPPLVIDGLGPDTLGIVVATDGLRVRSLPTVGEASERLEPTLPEGVRFYVLDNPVIADGYAWYQVQPYGDPLERVGPAGDWAQVEVSANPPLLPFGWVAAGSREGEPWIEHFNLGCDSIAPSAEFLVSGEPLEQLFCSVVGGNLESTVDGNVYCTSADDHNAVTGPDWISGAGLCELRTESGARRVFGQAVHELIDESNNPVEGRYTITGHFDDATAGECQAFVRGGGEAPNPAAVILSRRTSFVVTEVTPVP